MKIFRYIACTILLAAVSLPANWLSADQTKVYRVGDGRILSLKEMIGEVASTEVLLTGEIHNNIQHHQLQLETIKALNDAGVALAVGFEMFPREQQATLDRWTDGTLSPEDFKTFYEKHWSLPWSLYQDIFFYIREKRIPALALNAPSDVIETVSRTGFLSLTDEQTKRLPPGLGCNVDDKYMAFMRRVYSLHQMKDREFQYFCEMQLLWDKSMAWYLLDYLGKKPQRVVVVIAGLRHAWKKGIPLQVRQYSGDTRYAVLLPEVPGMVVPGKITLEDADYIGMR
jgi:uncharacterized iron-regulated protein